MEFLILIKIGQQTCIDERKPWSKPETKKARFTKLQICAKYGKVSSRGRSESSRIGSTTWCSRAWMPCMMKKFQS